MSESVSQLVTSIANDRTREEEDGEEDNDKEDDDDEDDDHHNSSSGRFSGRRQMRCRAALPPWC